VLVHLALIYLIPPPSTYNHRRMFGRSFQFAAKSSKVLGRRMMSGSQEEAKAEVARWTKVTIVMTGLCGLMAVYNVVFHDHEHARKDMPYLKMRTKPFPWECSDCDLFDVVCL
jgi:hypothetical protein